jgi:bacterioferritin
MASKKLLDMLNDAIAREIQVSVQYMWQHVMIKGIHAEAIGGIFKKAAIEEMKHAEAIAERLEFLGGVPTTKPTPIEVGKGAEEMLNLNKKAEEEAIKLYRQIIELAEQEKDYTTKRLFEGILADEEGHLNTFSNLLEK